MTAAGSKRPDMTDPLAGPSFRPLPCSPNVGVGVTGLERDGKPVLVYSRLERLGGRDMLTRRHVFLAGTALAVLAAGRLTRPGDARAATTYEVTHSDDEWRKLLSPD